MEEPAARIEGVSIVQSDNYTGPSLNLSKRNVPQSSIEEPNKSNAVTVTVFGNSCEAKHTAAVHGEASVLPPVLPPVLPSPRHISARKTAPVTSKKL